MDELLQQLEKRIKTLLQRFEEQQQVTLHLEHKQSTLLREKEMLARKNQMVVAQIENIISHLKSIETMPHE